MSKIIDIAAATAELQKLQATIATAKQTPAQPAPEPIESEEPDLDEMPTGNPPPGFEDHCDSDPHTDSEESEPEPCGEREALNGADRFGDPWTYTAKGDCNGLNQRYWAQAMSDRVFFETLDSSFHRFQAGLWQPVTRAQLRGMVDETVRGWFGHEDGAGFEKILADRKLDGVVNAIESFSTRTRAFQSSPENVILVGNGRLEKTPEGWRFSGEEGRPEDLKRTRYPANYDPTAKAPKVIAWLERMFSGRQDDVLACQKMAGACLSGKNKYKRFLVIAGNQIHEDSENQDLGKGKFLRLLSKIAGEECTAALRTKFLEEKHETRRFVGKTLLVAGDVPSNFLMLPGASKLKELTGQDVVGVENKGNDGGSYILGYYSIAVASNFRLIIISGADAGAWRTRLVYLIADGKPFEEGEKDINFLENLWEEEGPGILNWALEGLRMLEADGDWLLSEAQKETLNDILDESASITKFVKDRLEPTKNGGMTTENLYAGYRNYCTERGWVGFSEHAFVRKIGDPIYAKFKVVGDNKIEIAPGVERRGYPGIRLIENPEN